MDSQDRAVRAPERLSFSYDDAAEASGLSRSTLKRLVADGRLHAICVGRRRLIPRADLERLLTEGLS